MSPSRVEKVVSNLEAVNVELVVANAADEGASSGDNLDVIDSEGLSELIVASNPRSSPIASIICY